MPMIINSIDFIVGNKQGEILFVTFLLLNNIGGGNDISCIIPYLFG